MGFRSLFDLFGLLIHLVVISEREKEEGGNESVESIFKELALDAEMFPAEAMEGEWV